MKRTILYTSGFVVCFCFLCLIRQTSGQNTANTDLNYILCEGTESPMLTCSTTQIIIIEDAFYGRTDSSVCPHNSVKSSVSYSCKGIATNRVASKCDNKRTCVPQSSNAAYGDPCPYTYKYLNVTYRCIAELHYSTVSSTSVPSIEKEEFSTESLSSMYTTALSDMTTNHINKSTSSQIKKGSNKNIAGLVVGIAAGVGFIALIILICIRKRFSLSCFARNVPNENKNNEEYYTGIQNVAYINSNAFTIQGDNNYYATLGNETDGHNYSGLENSPQSEIEYHTNEPHSYMTVYDSFDLNRQSALTNATYEEVQQKEKGSPKILRKTGDKHYDYAEFATNLTPQDDINSKKSSQPNEYLILDPKETSIQTLEPDISSLNTNYSLIARDGEKVDLRDPYILCEDKDSPNLACPPTTIIKIEDAFYGRTNRSVCNDSRIRSISCNVTVTKIVESNCSSLHTCLPNASNDIYSDPCQGTYKYLNVTYRCIKDAQPSLKSSTHLPTQFFTASPSSSSKTEEQVSFSITGISPKKQSTQTSTNDQDYIGNQNIAMPRSGASSDYNDLKVCRESHKYGELKSVSEATGDSCYDVIDANEHKRETKVFSVEQSTFQNDSSSRSCQKYAMLNPSEKRKTKLNTSSYRDTGCDDYTVLEVEEARFNHPVNPSTDQFDKGQKTYQIRNNENNMEVTSTHNATREDYAVLDPKLTGFNRMNHNGNNKLLEKKAIFNPTIRDMEHDTTHPLKEDTKYYELAKPVNEDGKENICHKYDEDYGFCQDSDYNQLNAGHPTYSEEHVYNHTVDDVYDTTSHNKKCTTPDNTYDFFCGDKTDDDYNIPMKILFSIDPSCSVECLNCGTCLIKSCNCADGNTGSICEIKSLDIRSLRKIKFVTANENGDFSLPYFQKSVNKDSLYFNFSRGCPRNVTLLQETVNRTIEFIMETRNTTDTKIYINDSSMFRISVSCLHFQNIFISWSGGVFTFGTIHLFDNKLLRKTVENYSQKGTMYQAIFSSGVNTEWTLYEADAANSSVSLKSSSGKTYQVCPIFEKRKEFRVTVLNISSRCSQQLEIATECTTDRFITVKSNCSAIRDNCHGQREILWITVCTTPEPNSCNRCKIKNFRFDLTKTCSVADIDIVTKIRLNTSNTCIAATQYIIMWNEIKVEDQSSSTRNIPTTWPFTPTSTYGEHDLFTSSVEGQSSSTRSLQTTRSITSTYSEHVSYTSTASNIEDKDSHSMSDNQKVIGLTIGASVSAVIIVILLICLLIVIRRRSLETKSDKKNQTVQNSEDENDYTGRQNIALPMQGDWTEYNELAMRRDSHQYGDLKSVGTKLHETTYDYIDPHIHKQETDVCKNDELTSTNDPGVELIQEYSVLDPNEKTSNAVKVILNAGMDCDTYAVLDPDESLTLRSGALKNDRLDISVCESTCVHAKDESYAVLDPNITGFDRTENVVNNESPETYTVLDPKITGFNRSNLTHGPGDMTKDHVNKNGLIQPFKEDGTDYEFAKPIDDDMSSKSCLPSYRDRANSGGRYGTYETGNTQRLQDIHQQNPEENVYNRTTDDVYDSAAHKKMPTSRDDIYDHFSGEKTNECGKT
ncbi:unnamed protein product [Mytilus coruscus]|uniref:SUEL-type lectin domain-containing protein n=1 Tax=Mytilus coruscus TaxID=42192 RepID=A0A6J8BMW4_MYTCO|nr:unnamed protein product [Mytilus coruscus]